MVRGYICKPPIERLNTTFLRNDWGGEAKVKVLKCLEAARQEIKTLTFASREVLNSFLEQAHPNAQYSPIPPHT